MTKRERTMAKIELGDNAERKLKLLYLYRIENQTATQTSDILAKEYNWTLGNTTIRTYASNLDTKTNRELAIELFANQKLTIKQKRKKEFLYIGHYIDTQGRYILKIGTTNNLQRRATEHTRNYRKATAYRMPAESVFEYDWFIPLSKYNTLRFEDKTRANWQQIGVGEYVRNDRFNCGKHKPQAVKVTIRKTYTIEL